MAHLHCQEAELLITALVDGELDLSEMERIQGHLEMCEDCAARRDMETRLKSFLKERIFCGGPPDGLRERIRATLTRMDEADPCEPNPLDDPARMQGVPPEAAPTSVPVDTAPAAPATAAPKRWVGPLVFVVVLLATMFGMMLMMEGGSGGSMPAGHSPLTSELVALHRAAVGGGILQMRSTDPAAISAWLGQQTGQSGSLPDLSGQGLVPAGARVVQMEGEACGMVLYRDESPIGQPVVLLKIPPTVQLADDHKDTGATTTERVLGVGISYLHRDDMMWVATSERDLPAMTRLAKVLDGS